LLCKRKLIFSTLNSDLFLNKPLQPGHALAVTAVDAAHHPLDRRSAHTACAGRGHRPAEHGVRADASRAAKPLIDAVRVASVAAVLAEEEPLPEGDGVVLGFLRGGGVRAVRRAPASAAAAAVQGRIIMCIVVAPRPEA
jgi:hypothetical protein